GTASLTRDVRNGMSQTSSLARVFSYLSLLTIGGGMAAYPEMSALVVDRHHWLTVHQLDYLFGVSQAAPGPNMMVVVLIGSWSAAFFGPPAVLAFVAGRLWTRLRGRPWVVVVHRGLTPVSIGLLLAGCFTFARGALNGWITSLVALGVFAVVFRSRINPAFLVL